MHVCACMCVVYVGVSVPIMCVSCIIKVIFVYVNVSGIPEPSTPSGSNTGSMVRCFIYHTMVPCSLAVVE